MEFIISFFGIITNIDEYLKIFVANHGTFVYFLVFLIIFLETGTIIFAFLPGDTLIFAAGALAASSHLNIIMLLFILSIGAILGDSVNYYIGKNFGHVIINKNIIKAEQLEKTHVFFEKHGGQTIIYSRFVPIVRSLAPLVAGMSNMEYKYFLKFNIFGGILWTISFLFLGYFFGNIPYVKNNFHYIVLAVILFSLLLSLISFLYKKIKQKYKSKR